MGFGYFSTVWLASDQTLPAQHPHKLVAIKISKSHESFQESAQEELKLLNLLGNDQDSGPFVVKLLDQFVHRGPHGKHFCLVFEPMWKNLEYMIKKFHYRGLPVKLLKLLTYQVLCGLENLHQKRIIHTDIKPENFLIAFPTPFNPQELAAERAQYLKLKAHLSSPAYSSKSISQQETKILHRKMDQLLHLKTPEYWSSDQEIKVKIYDLGCACQVHHHLTTDITPLIFRGPEIILGYPYGTGVDMFACGTMIYEMATGKYLFKISHNPYFSTYTRNEQHLAKMVAILGSIPHEMIKKGKYSPHYFQRPGYFRHRWPRIKKTNLVHLLQKTNFPREEIQVFADFLSQILRVDPRLRWSATQAKNHPWLNEIHLKYQSLN